MANCVLGKNSLLHKNFFTSSQILRGAYFCGNANVTAENKNIADFNNVIIPNSLKIFEDEIFYNDSIWFSFACQKDIDNIYCFDIPCGGLSMFRYYGVTQNLINSKENEHISLTQTLNTLTSRYRGTRMRCNFPNNLFLNLSIDEQKLSKLSHVIMKFDNKKGKVIYNNIHPVINKCIPCGCSEDVIMFNDKTQLFMEWLCRKLYIHFRNRNLLNEKDILLLNLYYNKNTFVFFRFGFPEHKLVNKSLDELISNTTRNTGFT
jgi:hypothetical protein